LKVFSLQQHIQAWAWLFKVMFYASLLVGCYMAFTPVEGGIQAKFNDKLLHASGFFIMAFTSQLAHPKTRFMILFIGLSCFGLTIELVQAYLPYRSFSMWDLAADILGLGLYFIFFGHFLKDKPSPY
tara:strand:+ start:21439 stop:21819 length:381 start_codon:yes stop_codon:yes gene_type:complete